MSADYKSQKQVPDCLSDAIVISTPEGGVLFQSNRAVGFKPGAQAAGHGRLRE